jgi:hypothetical protein
MWHGGFHHDGRRGLCIAVKVMPDEKRGFVPEEEPSHRLVASL